MVILEARSLDQVQEEQEEVLDRASALHSLDLRRQAASKMRSHPKWRLDTVVPEERCMSRE